MVAVAALVTTAESPKAEGTPTVLPKKPEVTRVSPKAGKALANDVAVVSTVLLVLPNEATVVCTLPAVPKADTTLAVVVPAAVVKALDPKDRPFKLLVLPSLPASEAPLEGTKKVPKLELPVLKPFRPDSDGPKDFPRFS